MIKDELFIKFKANETKSTYDSKNNLNRPLSFTVCSKLASQCVMDAFIYLLHMRNQWITGKKITCQFPERTDVDKQTRLVYKWEQLELIRHDLESCLLLQLEVFIHTIFWVVQPGILEKKYGIKHLLSFCDIEDTVLGALYIIKHLLLTKDPLSKCHSNPNFYMRKLKCRLLKI